MPYDAQEVIVRAGDGAQVVIAHAFTSRAQVVYAPSGATVAQILTEAVRCGLLEVTDLPYAVVHLDGERQEDREAVLDLVPPDGAILNVSILPQGPAVPALKALEAVLHAAQLALSHLIGAKLAASFTLKALLKTVATSLVLSGAKALVNKLFAHKSAAEAQTYTLSGQSNQARPRQMMPLVLGAGRVVFDVASSAYTTVVGNDVFLTVIYGIHYGPCTVTDLKIGETLASAYPAGDVSLEWFLTPGPRNSALYPMRVVQQSFQDELDPEGGWTVHSTDVDCERFEIDLFWPAFYYASSNGKVEPADMNIFIQWADYGSGVWHDPPTGVYPSGVGLGGRTYPANEFYATACSKEHVMKTTGWTFATKGRYDIRIRRTVQGGTSDQNVRDVTWTALRTIENKKPLIDETLSVVVARFKATNNINGNVAAVSGVVTPLTPHWTGSAWQDAMADWQPSSNAVELMRFLLMGPPAGAFALTSSQFDASMNDQVATSAPFPGQVLVQEDSVSQEAVMKLLGQMGRFDTYWNGSRLCFFPDGIKAAPVQMFTARNASDYDYRREFPDPVHAVLVEFVNTDVDGRPDELIVYADGYDESTATILETFKMPYGCSIARAWKEGRRWLASKALHVENHEWTCGIDALVSTYGDRVLMRHPSALFGLAEGRVQFRRWAGALVSGVRLDQPVTMEAGKTYAIDARTPTGILRGLAVVNAETTTRDLVFPTPLAEAAAPGKGDLIAFGEVDVVTEDLEITDLDPQSDRTVKIKARAYKAVEIAAAESGTVPDLQTALTTLNDAPVPRLLSATATPDGAKVVFAVELQREAPIKEFRARWRLTLLSTDAVPGDWHDMTPLSATQNAVRTPPVGDAISQLGDTDAQVYVDVEVRTVLMSGRVSLPLVVDSIPIRRSAPAVTTFTATGVTRTATDGSAYPAIAISADAVVAGSAQDLVVEISAHGAATWTSAAQPLPAANPVGDIVGISSAGNYDVRAKWRTADGWVSDDWAEVDGVTIPSDSSVAGSAGSVPWSGVIDDNTHKPTDDADVTAANTAAAIAGQGALATLSALTTAIANASNLLRYAAGGLFTGELAADVTSSHTASAIAGQGSLATLSALTTAISNASNLLRYTSGGLFTGELTADQTSAHTASAITGQGALATLSQVTASLLARSDGSNMIRDAVFGDSAAWSSTGATVSLDTSTDTTTTMGIPRSVKIVATAATGQATSGYIQASAAYEQVQAGKSYTFFAGVLHKVGFKGQTYIQVTWFKQDGTTQISTNGAAVGTDYRSAARASTDENTVISGALVAPALAVYARATLGVFWPAAAASAGTAFIGNPSMFRTVDSGLLTSTAVIIGTNIVRADGTTSATEAILVTSLGTASAISGQGALATVSSAAWGSQVSGRPTELTDGRVSTALNSSGQLLTALTTTLANSSNLLRYTSGGLFTGELTADTTSTHTASAITGQGSLATLSTINSSSLISSGVVTSAKLSTTAVVIGTNIVRADGTTSVTEALVVTSLGTASAISGQGSLATLSTINSSTLISSGVVTSAKLSTTAVVIGTNIVRADGTTSATEVLIVTSLGTASAISGQGSMATQNASSVAITGGSLAIGSNFAVDSSGNVTIKSASSGQRLEISNSLVKVYDSSGTLRVQMGVW